MGQECFARLLEKRWLGQTDRAMECLCSFLITALKHFMAKEWRRQSAQKRGGGRDCLPMNAEFAASRYAAELRRLAAALARSCG